MPGTTILNHTGSFRSEASLLDSYSVKLGHRKLAYYIPSQLSEKSVEEKVCLLCK